jgi:YD repeat-containing protein
VVHGVPDKFKSMGIQHVDSGPRQVSRAIEVQESAEQVFELVANAHRHGELDGSGTVMAAVTGPPRLAPGARFTVGMKMYGLPYRITSRVTRFEEGRLVEWRHPMGHHWRWELTRLTPTSSRVTETFDYSTVPGLQAKAFELFGFPRMNGAGIEATLCKLASRSATTDA